MKGKKLLSMLTAGALAVSMVMPAMAADGGTVDVDVTTKTGILRVEVPTTLAIAVDQFETTDAGTQIYSEEFKIANKSEVNVKVNVTSTATVKNGVALAATRGDVATATAAGGTAWLAVAASLDGTKYEAANKLENLNEASANVTTFANGSTGVTAAQTFYLEKATGEGYKLLKPAADKKNVVSYAQFYELTAIATQPTDDATLQTAVDASDVYVGSETAGSETDGAGLTKIEKGTTVAGGSNAWATGKVYYTAAAATTPAASVDASKLYVYGEMTTAGSNQPKAAFRYIGELSRNKELWDATDISKVSIAYTIQGLPQSVYAAAAADTSDPIVYGLYKEKLTATYSEVSGVYWLSVDGNAGFAAAPTSLTIGGAAKTAGTDYTFEKSGWIKLKDAPTAGDEIVLIVNGTTYKVTVPTP